FVLTASEDRTARLWDRAGNQVAVFAADSAVCYAVFNPDGTRVFSAAADGALRLFDVAQRTPTITLNAPEAPAEAMPPPTPKSGSPCKPLRLIFSPDGRRILTLQSSTRLWDAETGKLIAVLKSGDGEVRWAAFDALGKRILTLATTRGRAFEDTARLWAGD